MSNYAQRQNIVTLAKEARPSVSWRKISAALNVSEDTLQRWCASQIVAVDKRSTAKRSTPTNKLSLEEEKAILAVCNEPEYASLPPEVIVATLADKGIYLGSASTFYRILRKAKQLKHRGKSKASQKRSVPRLVAKNPNEVWSWDITYLPASIKGGYFFLYLIIDIYSRKIIAAEVYENESGTLAASLLEKASLREGGNHAGLILHADNGSPMKAMTMKMKMAELKMTESYSRPHTSNDNAYSESLFKTLKYCPAYPENGFATLEKARQWVHEFVQVYNNVHKHSAIKYVTPGQRHEGKDKEILKKRNALFLNAKTNNPTRWAQNVKNWKPVGDVWINEPMIDEKKTG